MTEIRASHIGAEYDPDRADPILVTRDEYGVLRPVNRIVRMRAEFVGGNLKGHGEVLVLEAEQSA